MSATSKRILIVDDEPAIRRSLHLTMNALGFEIAEASRGEDALSLVRTSRFDAVVLDRNMPGIGGLETCRRMRQFSASLPILVMSVHASADDIVEALDVGADDYLTKPFNLRELVSRLSALMRRAHRKQTDPTKGALVIGDIELDPERHLLLKAGRPIHLTPKEFDLLRFLMSHAGKPVPHERLLKSVWGFQYRGELEYLRTFMRQIRKKIEDDPANPRYLLTDLQIGYHFAAKV